MKKKKERIEMKILVVGDIVGRPGRKTLKSYLEKYRENYDFIIVNGENAAAGFGITEKLQWNFCLGELTSLREEIILGIRKNSMPFKSEQSSDSTL